MPSGSHLSESLPHTRHQTTNAVCFMLSVGISTAVSARCVLIVALAPELNLDLICFTQQRMVCALWCPFKSPQQSLPCEFCFVPYSCMKPVMSKYFTDGAIQKTTCYDQNTLRQVMRPRFASMHVHSIQEKCWHCCYVDQTCCFYYTHLCCCGQCKLWTIASGGSCYNCHKA